MICGNPSVFQFHVSYGVVPYFYLFVGRVRTGIARGIAYCKWYRHCASRKNTKKSHNLNLIITWFVFLLFSFWVERASSADMCAIIFISAFTCRCDVVSYTYAFYMVNTRWMLWNYLLPNNMCRLVRRAQLAADAFHGIRNAVHTPASKRKMCGK